jgi:hypothetical protein
MIFFEKHFEFQKKLVVNQKDEGKENVLKMSKRSQRGVETRHAI